MLYVCSCMGFFGGAWRAVFWKRRRHPWWACRVLSGPMMLSRGNLTLGPAFMTSFFLSHCHFLLAVLPRAQIYEVLCFPSPFPEFRSYRFVNPPPPLKAFSQLGTQIISCTFEKFSGLCSSQVNAMTESEWLSELSLNFHVLKFLAPGLSIPLACRCQGAGTMAVWAQLIGTAPGTQWSIRVTYSVDKCIHN